MSVVSVMAIEQCDTQLKAPVTSAERGISLNCYMSGRNRRNLARVKVKSQSGASYCDPETHAIFVC